MIKPENVIDTTFKSDFCVEEEIKFELITKTFNLNDGTVVEINVKRPLK